MKYTNKEEFKKANYFGTGIYNFMLKNNMTGKTYVKPLTMAGGSMMLANVTFEPGARSFWHIHRAVKGGGQIIICTAGEGWYQAEGQDPIELKPGVVVNIPKDLLHWHGAKKDSYCSHIAIEVGGEGIKNEFVRPVSDEDYNSLEDGKRERADVSNEFDIQNVFGKGQPNDMFAKYFVGNSYLYPLTNSKEGTGIFLANVTFEPGCRNNWHIHHSSKGGGQILVCTAGEGFYQEEGKKVRRLKPGDIVYIKPNIKHWHGAQKDKWFSHISIEVPGEETSNEWLEKVDDEYYSKL